MCPSETHYERLQVLHHKGLCLSLEVPAVASNKKVVHEAHSLPLCLLTSQALLTRLVRLNESFTGRAPIRRFRTRHRSYFSAALNTLKILGLKNPKRRQQSDPPWMLEDVICDVSIPRLPSKRSTLSNEARCLVLQHLEVKYSNCLHV